MSRATSIGAGIGGATGAAIASTSSYSALFVGVAAAAGALTGYAGYVCLTSVKR